ncbi:MAG: hypothetical protein KDA25_12250, partial [Phycisphaerales bacterium]|nr:hypothetical protein [Phycisphaerales bacterium]
MGAANAGAAVLVDVDALGANDGTTWTDAFTDLHDALAAVGPGGAEIWVAEGTYYTGPLGAARTESFTVPDGAALYGGFSGVETARAERDWIAHPTILSGDLARDGGASFADDAYHVLVATNADFTLDGFTVTNGAAGTSSGMNSFGGGAYVDGGNATVANTIFLVNHGSGGAGVALVAGTAHFTGTTFRENATYFYSGGGLWVNQNASATIEDCLFDGNQVRGAGSEGNGAGVFSYGSLDIARTIFVGNRAYQFSASMNFNSNGGAILSLFGPLTITDSAFYGNAAQMGGAIWVGSDTTIVNTVFSGNQAEPNSLIGDAYEAAIRVFLSDVSLVGVTMVGNHAAEEGGAIVAYSTPIAIEDSILWDNTSLPGTHPYLAQ